MTTNKQVSALLIAALLATGVATTASARDGDMRGMRGENRAEMFTQLDADGDGNVSAEEFEAGGNPFARADTDGNGLLTAEELAAAGQDRAQRRIASMIERLDTNKDGALSQEEIEARRSPERMFERLDANDDGVISAEEFAEARMGDRDGRGFHGKRRGNR